MKHNVISIDLAKTNFQVCALDDRQRIVLNRPVKRENLLNTLRQIPPTTVVMEACYSSNHWGRCIAELGHEVKLIPPFQVKPFVVGNKNDANDALAIAEAANRPKTRFVAVKTLAQQDIQTIVRIRDRRIRHRTGVANQLRGLLSEYGIAIAKSTQSLRRSMPVLFEDSTNGLTVVARTMLRRLWLEWETLSSDIEELNHELQALLSQQEDYQRLQSIPGIGPITAALLIASVGDARQFKNGRQLAAWVGLTPRQHSSGEQDRMGRITKRGNAPLRRLVVQGARSVINWCQKKDDALSRWLKTLLATKHPCKVVVALANKLMRIVWSVLTSRQPFNMALACR